MAKFHLTPAGDARVCKAVHQCPFGGDEVHFRSEKEARMAYERGQSPFASQANEAQEGAVRTLVRTETVSAVEPIANADAIEAVRVGGWRVVVQKGEFQAGDEVIYMELDSALPLSDPRFAFLGTRSTKTIDDKPYHVLKSAKLRGVVSQGIVFKRSDFPELDTNADLAPQLGVFKYEPPLPLENGSIIGRWDTTIQKTDSERAQNLTHWLPTVNPSEWEATVKVDGTSSTIRVGEDGNHRVFSRNYEVDRADTRMEIAVQTGLLEGLKPGQSVQFELMGPGINRNRQKLKQVRPYVFTVLDADGNALPRSQWPAKAQEYAVPTVDISHMDRFDVDSLMALSDNLRGSVTADVKDEGIVFHHREGKRFAELGDRDTFKIVSDKYLLKHGE